MKALSLTQPWAWSMVHGPKRTENRTWPAPEQMIGQTFAMHASAKWDAAGERFILEQGVLVPPRGTWALPHSAIIGVATLVRCVKYEMWKLCDKGRKLELVTEDQWPWFFGPFGFVLENVRPITPIPYPGSLSFFDLTEDAEREVLSRLGEKADILPAPMASQQTMPWEPPGGLHRPSRKPASKVRGRR